MQKAIYNQVTDIAFTILKRHIRFSVKHNLPNVPGMSIMDAVDNWVHRTDAYTAKSLCAYINGKDSGFSAEPHYEPKKEPHKKTL